MPKRGFKRRYLALRLIGNGVFSRNDLWRSLVDTYLRLYGEYGLSKANLKLIELRGDGVAILSVSHKSLPYLRAALTLIREVDERKAMVHVIGVSGTIKRLKAKFLNLENRKS